MESNIIKQRGRGVKSLKKIYEKEFLINSSPNSNVGVSNGEDDTSSINSETRSVLSYIESDGFIKIIKRELNKLVKFKFYNHLINDEEKALILFSKTEDFLKCINDEIDCFTSRRRKIKLTRLRHELEYLKSKLAKMG